MGMTDKIMDKLHGRSNTGYRYESGVQHGGMMGKMKDSINRVMGSRRR